MKAASVVVDASVVIKWVVQEAGSRDALGLLDGPVLAAPDLLVSEYANILWKKARRGELTRDEAMLSAELLQHADVELVPMRALMTEALKLAADLDHPVYDCMYLALAIERGDVFVTADKRFVQALRQGPRRDLLVHVSPLGDVAVE